MGLFDLFKKKPDPKGPELSQNEIELVKPRSVGQVPHIHPDLEGLIWFGDGPLKNYTRTEHKGDSYTFEGITISISFSHDEEPSLIYINEPIAIPKDEKSVERPPYYPSYKSLTPEQRWIYLKLLANPYDASIDVGFVFILYYGLERHLLSGDIERAVEVVLKLRDVHTNKSFQSYSANAIVLCCMLKQRGDLALSFINSLDKDHEFSFSDNLFLICYFSFDMPLKAKDIMRMAKSFEFTNTNYIKKYPDLFEEALGAQILQRLSTHTVTIKDFVGKTELRKVKTEPHPIFANMSIRDKDFPVPIIADSFKLKKELFTLLELAHEAVKLKLAGMKKNGIVPPEAVVKKREKKVIAFSPAQEALLLKELEQAKGRPMDRHFAYIQLQDFYYKLRSLGEEYVDKCIEYCLLDIDSLGEVRDQYLKDEAQRIKQAAEFMDPGYEEEELKELKSRGFEGYVPAFNRLIIIYEKRKEFFKAIEICDRSLEYVRSRELFEERKADLLKKLAAQSG